MTPVAAFASPIARRGDTAALVESLRAPSAYDHPVGTVDVVETHISYVLLAGDYAYKIKKPVRLPFLDFTSLEQRRFFCEEELRLNRRTAADLYLDVVKVGGDPPRFGGCGEAIEYAVRMRRFSQEALASERARAGTLEPRHVDALAARIAAFHAVAAPVAYATAAEAAARATQPALDNFAEIETIAPWASGELGMLRDWTRAEATALGPRLAERAREGFVRECHGDLHLANVALIGDEPVLFDCIEFAPTWRQIDVMSEIAFPIVGLVRHGRRALAARFLDAYLRETGDYAGLRVLRFYLAYRAMVRAKIACIRGDSAKARLFFRLARRYTTPAVAALFAMHGLPASGKTSCAQRLLEAVGAVRLRSDDERKRLHGLRPLERSFSLPGAGIYTPADSDDTYCRLALLAQVVLDAGFPVVVDAACLQRRQRDLFREVARAAGAGFSLIDCSAPDPVLRARIRARSGDASEADEGVLDLLRARAEPLAADEIDSTLTLQTG
jgi:uncharacterized protein